MTDKFLTNCPILVGKLLTEKKKKSADSCWTLSPFYYLKRFYCIKYIQQEKHLCHHNNCAHIFKLLWIFKLFCKIWIWLIICKDFFLKKRREKIIQFWDFDADVLCRNVFWLISRWHLLLGKVNWCNYCTFPLCTHILLKKFYEFKKFNAFYTVVLLNKVQTGGIISS